MNLRRKRLFWGLAVGGRHPPFLVKRKYTPYALHSNMISLIRFQYLTGRLRIFIQAIMDFGSADQLADWCGVARVVLKKNHKKQLGTDKKVCSLT